MKRVFVFQDFKSQKFWSIEVVGTDITVNYGKLGTDGQTQVKNYATTEEAEKAASKLIAEKTKKGYVETAEETPRSMPSVSDAMVWSSAMSSRDKRTLFPFGCVQSKTTWA